jgi:hypothetical protein
MSLAKDLFLHQLSAGRLFKHGHDHMNTPPSPLLSDDRKGNTKLCFQIVLRCEPRVTLLAANCLFTTSSVKKKPPPLHDIKI